MLKLKRVGLTPLQVLQKKYWQDLGTCERVRIGILALPGNMYKQEALEYVARAKKIIVISYKNESDRIKEELEALKAEGWK